MEFHLIPDDDRLRSVLELDREGIDYLVRGLERLRDMPPGEELNTPMLNDDGASDFVLRRAAER